LEISIQDRTDVDSVRNLEKDVQSVRSSDSWMLIDYIFMYWGVDGCIRVSGMYIIQDELFDDEKAFL
jgi:hypothetical protein